MGKRIITQRRGKGSLTYRSPGHRYSYPISYPKTEEKITTEVFKIIKNAGRTAPLALIKINNEISSIPAALNLREGDIVSYNEKNDNAKLQILKLKDIPEGTSIYNIEGSPGDGGKFCRAAGTGANVVLRTPEYIVVKLPSRKEHRFNPNCKATIGIIAGGGKAEKPMLKAGKYYHIMKARNKLYPKTSGVAMNAVDHPFGSGRGRHVGKPKTPKKNAPPGRNVGAIRARRTGRKR